MKKETMNEIIKPFLVLVIICLAASALLAVTNELTAGVIAQHAEETAAATRQSVLPGSGSFTEVEVQPEWNVDSIYKEDSGLGYVITASYKGYGGDVTVTLGINNSGSITGISADVSSETSGIGTKAGTKEHLEQYLGDGDTIDDVNFITSATYSSTAVHKSVDAALKAYEALK